MIQKYLDENVLLIPNTVYKEREKYEFQWTIDKRFKLTGYNAFYAFPKPGIHKIELKVKDLVTEACSIYNNVINITKPDAVYVEPWDDNLGFGLSRFGLDGFGG